MYLRIVYVGFMYFSNIFLVNNLVYCKKNSVYQTRLIFIKVGIWLMGSICETTNRNQVKGPNGGTVSLLHAKPQGGLKFPLVRGGGGTPHVTLRRFGFNP